MTASSCLFAADPIFRRRQVADVTPRPNDLTAASAKAASYKPLFGIGDQDVDQLKGVARYGELTVGPGGTSAIVGYPAEEQIYFVEEGSGTLLYGDEKAPIKANDFMYLPAGVRHGVANSSNAPGGTNIPHNHATEEEVYFLLRGSGDMVAGLDSNGKEVRHPVTQGAAFFFKPATQVGYYSNAKEGQPHDLMLVARSRVPGMSMPGRGGPENPPGRQ